MATGTNTTPSFLWKARFKINTPDGGINFTLHMAETIEADAKTRAADIANRLKSIMPSTCELYACTISKDDTKKDSRLIPNVIGPGLYGIVDDTSDETVYNRFNDAILVRFENVDGGGTTMKICPIPDSIIANGSIVLPISAVTDFAPAVAAGAAQPVTYATEFTKLMHAIGKYCHHVKVANHVPGGTYTYFPFSSAVVKRVGGKKGARVFVK